MPVLAGIALPMVTKHFCEASTRPVPALSPRFSSRLLLLSSSSLSWRVRNAGSSLSFSTNGPKFTKLAWEFVEAKLQEPEQQRR
eukprot:699071-Amphidinium_carterae.1